MSTPYPAVAPPALFTRMSIRPNSAMAFSTMAFTEAESVTSVGTTRQARPVACTSLAVSSSWGRVRAAATLPVRAVREGGPAMKVHLPYGRQGLDVELPDRAHVLLPERLPSLGDPLEAVRQALREPIGSPPPAARVETGGPLAL